jgi:hypothetical protein
MRKKFGLRWSIAGLTFVAILTAGVFAAVALAGATSTTDNAGFVDGTYTTQNCLNGSSGVNCNIYLDKRDVWTSGLPSAASLSEGDYFLAVLAPGGQHDPNDGGLKNLSTFDTWSARSFHVDATGTVSALGGTTHAIDHGKIQLSPYADTPNNGGVYILAICAVPESPSPDAGVGAPGVDPHVCKYDAFKVLPAVPCTTDCNTGVAADPSVSKTAGPAFGRAFTWNIAKNVDKSLITQYNGSPTATFHYTVTVNVLSHTDSGWTVGGNITVSNTNTSGDPLNPDDITGVNVSDAINGESNANCPVSNGSLDGLPPLTVDHTNATIPDNGSVTFPYTCTYTAAPAAPTQTNTATISWPGQVLDDGSALLANSNTGTASIDWSAALVSLTDDCVNVTDTLYGGTLSSGVCADASSNILGTGTLGSNVTGTLNPTSGPPYTSLDLKYARTIPSPPLGGGSCSTTNNTATFTTDDNGNIGTANQSVQVCNYLALTIGYWGNHLANSAKTGLYRDSYCTSKTIYSGTGCSSNGLWTIQFLPQPIGGYSVTSVSAAAQIISQNNCSNASSSSQNAIACLAAQLLAAELNVATGLSNSCIVSLHDGITDATNWLKGQTVDSVAGVIYVTPSTSYSLPTVQRNEALALKNVLVNFNQGGGC